MPTSEKSRKTLDLGPTGRAVSENLARIRKSAGITADQLVKSMADHGHKMPRTAISDIEGGYRKVGVDDLMALAVALGVNPNGLLAPLSTGSSENVEISGSREAMMAMTMWGWLKGVNCLGPFDDPAIFRRRAMPRWLVEQDESMRAKMDALAAQNAYLMERLMTGQAVDHGDD